MATSRVQLLDGGTGEELFRRGLPDDRTLWSASALVHPEQHELVRQVHEAFLVAGADYLTCNNYGVTAGVGFSEGDIVRYSALAGTLAVEARARAGSERATRLAEICGSLPPLLESYRADRVMVHDEGVRLYSLIARALEPHVDLFLAETLSSVAEAKMALVGVRDLGKPVMVSFTLNAQGRLRSGEAVDDAVNELLRVVQFDAVGVELRAVLFNCAQPEHIVTALRVLAADEALNAQLAARGVKLGAYANRLTEIPDDWTLHESAEPQAMRVDLSVQRYTDFVTEWVALGAQIVGGCCGIGPEYIRSMDERLVQQGLRVSRTSP